jgi:hypothetical protein
MFIRKLLLLTINKGLFPPLLITFKEEESKG